MPPSQKISRELPADFFNLTKEEVCENFKRLLNFFNFFETFQLKAEQQRRTEILEREGILRTKAMREKEEAKAKRRYKYCLIRVRFPDGWVLQGTFSVYETLSQVMELVTESLSSPLPYILVDSATGESATQCPQFSFFKFKVYFRLPSGTRGHGIVSAGPQPRPGLASELLLGPGDRGWPREVRPSCPAGLSPPRAETVIFC